MDYDELVVKCFLENQLQLFPKPVAANEEEALDFLSECMAVVCADAKEVWDYFDDSGVDISEMDEKDILGADEVFDIGDGRYLIVEC